MVEEIAPGRVQFNAEFRMQNSEWWKESDPAGPIPLIKCVLRRSKGFLDAAYSLARNDNEGEELGFP